MSRFAYWAFMTGWLIVVMGAAVALSLPAAPVPVTLSLDRYQCSVPGSAALPEREFRVLTSTNILARDLADILCHDRAMAGHYSKVTVSWQPRGTLHTEDLVQQQYHLIWRRERELRGLLGSLDDYYAVLQPLPTYAVHWISRNDKPVLSAEYFASRRVGLLRDTMSQSSYQLPAAQLQQAGITLAPDQVHYYEDRRALYLALSRGEVDLISGVVTQQEGGVPPSRRLLIADAVPTGQWYVSRQVPLPAVRCTLLMALQVQAPLFRGIDPQFRIALPEACTP